MKSNRTLYAISTIALSIALLAGCNRSSVRTDAQVASDVQNKIYSDAAVQSRSITVQAASGVVTLSGDVSSDAERVAAANDAGAIQGVKTVINNLQVQQAQVAPPPTPEPTAAPTPKPKKSEAARARRHHHASAPADESADQDMQAQNAPPVMPEPQPQAQPEPPQPPPPPPPPQKVTIPAGTQLSVRLNDPLDSEKNQVAECPLGATANGCPARNER